MNPPSDTPPLDQDLVILALEAQQARSVATGLRHTVGNAVQGLDVWANHPEALPDAARAEMLRDVRRAYARLDPVVRVLTAAIRRPGGEIAPITVPELLDDVALWGAMQLDGGGPPLRTAAEPRLPAVSSGPMIRQALLALVANAREAMVGAAGSEVRLDARALEDGVAFHVADRGPGIAPPERERIFTLGYTTKGPPHLGLGLAAVRRIAERLEGRVWVKGEAPSGEGATLVFWVPGLKRPSMT